MFNGKDFQRNVFIPIHDSGHWMLIIINCQAKRLEFYDTFHSDGSQFCSTVMKFMEEEAQFTEKNFNKDDWSVMSSSDIPRQTDGHR